MHVLYTAIEGRPAGLPLFESIADARAASRPCADCGAARDSSVRRAFKIVVRVIAGLFALVFLYLSVTFVQVYHGGTARRARPSHAIIVLGAAQYDGRPSQVLAARLDHAIDLYRRGIAPSIVVTGGKQPGDRFTEAGASANYLHDHGVPDSAILRETTGRTSWESLEAAARVPEGAAMTQRRARLRSVSLRAHRRRSRTKSGSTR